MLRIRLNAQADATEWRDAARSLIQAGVPASGVEWRVGPDNDLFGGADPLPAPRPDAPAPRVPRDFPSLLEAAICHSDPGRFSLLYRLLYRLQDQPGLLDLAHDQDVRRLSDLVKSVRRDCHKMHAFVRFREITPATDPRRFVAWFEPDHHIIARATPFFARRFADMEWLILTPQGSANFHAGQLTTDEVAASKPDLEDATETLWRTYYASIFNPARLKIRAMQSEMPRKYWKNLPEADLIAGLIAGADARVAEMAAQQTKAPPAFHAAIQARRAMPQTAPPADAWQAMRLEAAACTRCALHAQATQTVLGAGPTDAALMIVGEQPGDHEDLGGSPFVGPAGQVLEAALDRAGIMRAQVYLTNAVKHFKFIPRGKKRLHQRPDGNEVAHCRWWLQREIQMIRPRLIVAMGATAMLGLTGKTVKIGEIRGKILRTPDGTAILPTWHPAYLLRLPDPDRVRAETAHFQLDLQQASAFLAGA